MKQLDVYLIYNGNCEEALNFYVEKLGGEITEISRFSEMPQPVPEEHKNRLMHSVYTNDDVVIMASDGMPDQPMTIGNNVNLSVTYENLEAMEKAFANLSEGGKVIMELQDTFWGSRFGMLEDKFGICWMFSHSKES